MKTSPGKVLLLAAGLLIIGNALYVWLSPRGTTIPTPTISVTAPAGGESWLTGSTQTLSWTTSSVPSSYRVAVSIKRIPPPPLQTEGQEFDPLVFTDLPNSGSIAWNISAMYPPGTYVLGLTAYEKTPVTNATSAESAPFTLTPPLTADLYPLYSASWNAPHLVSLDIPSAPLSGTGIEALVATSTMNPGAAFGPFDTYYAGKLKAHGWQVDNSLAAGGPGRGQVVYRKGTGFIAVNFWTDFHTVSSTSPMQCPCDVTLKLFSTTER